MEQKTDVQLFDEAATQLEEALSRLASKNNISITFDATLLSTCRTKMNRLKTWQLLGLSGPSFRKEVDRSICETLGVETLDETVREQLFDTHIRTIDKLISTDEFEETPLRSAAIFMRYISIGIESYRIKVAQSRQH